MEILARIDKDGSPCLIFEDLGVGLDRLRELAEADKDGRVVVLPCKAGDSVFLIDRENGCCHECEVDFVNIGRSFKTVVVRSKSDGEQCGAFFGALGKTVFLTREAAEAALKENETCT